MQIFTYVDSNLALQVNREIKFDSVLNNEMRKKRSREKVLKQNVKEPMDFASFNDAVQESAFSIKKFFVSHKILVLVLACVYAASILVPLTVSSINVAVKKIKLNVFNDVDQQMLDSAMKKFAFSEYDYSFDDEGYVAASGSKLQYAIESVTFTKYKVKSGDNITSITKKSGLSNISTIISVNGITNDRALYSGQTIKIPSMDGLLYTVKSNDNLASIAKRYSISQEALLDVNDLSSSTLKAGQQLFIPGATLDPETLKQTLGTTFICPVKAKWRLTSAYGYRSDPFTGVKKFHTGMDMACPTGTPVYSTMSGKVIEVSYNSIYGNYIIVSHSNGYQSVYAHLSASNVKKGQVVDQGAKIGLVGSTGYSTGPHLHFTVYKNGKLQNPQALLKR